jgi:hypothetical protein
MAKTAMMIGMPNSTVLVVDLLRPCNHDPDPDVGVPSMMNS